MRTSSTQMYGYPWASLTKYGQAAIHDLTPYKVTRHVMENAGERRSSFTVCRHSMILRQRSEKRWASVSTLQIWRLQAKYSSLRSPGIRRS